MGTEQPTFKNSRWRITAGKPERMRMLQHLARCNGTGETFYLCMGKEFTVDEVASWYESEADAQAKIDQHANAGIEGDIWICRQNSLLNTFLFILFTLKIIHKFADIIQYLL